MTQTNKNRLFAVVLIIIPVASYCYFLTDFIDNKAMTENTGKHRYRIGKEQTTTLTREKDNVVK